MIPAKDYYELCKPNVVLLMLLTSLVGMYMSTSDDIPTYILIYGNLGIALCAASAAVINHLVDQNIDQKMNRTKNRPVAQGRVDKTHALYFSIFLCIVGTSVLWFIINPLSAILTVMSSIGYAFVYTLFLKRATPQNIVIGGLAGAMPPLLGWVCVTNSIDYNALLLVLIIYAWTPPHFWALAIYRKDEYAKAGIPMLPVTHGVYHTKIQIILYTLLMIIASILPFLTKLCGLLYVVTAVILGVGFLICCYFMLSEDNKKAPIITFVYSIIYLMLLFIVMLIDHQLAPKLPLNVNLIL